MYHATTDLARVRVRVIVRVSVIHYRCVRAAFLDWVYCGKPRIGVTYDTMRRTRSQFKLALRYCKQHSKMLRADAHATALMSKNFNKFWNKIKTNVIMIK